MAGSKEVETVQTPEESPSTSEESAGKKKPARSKTSNAKLKRSARSDASQPAMATGDPSAIRATRRTYSANERTQKLSEIQRSLGRGDSLKNAARQAGISEQTYYQWKKAAAPGVEGVDLKDLLALEEENRRLKSLLADRLRKENAELKRKLGLA